MTQRGLASLFCRLGSASFGGGLYHGYRRPLGLRDNLRLSIIIRKIGLAEAR